MSHGTKVFHNKYFKFLIIQMWLPYNVNWIFLVVDKIYFCSDLFEHFHAQRVDKHVIESVWGEIVSLLPTFRLGLGLWKTICLVMVNN